MKEKTCPWSRCGEAGLCWRPVTQTIFVELVWETIVDSVDLLLFVGLEFKADDE